MDMDLPAIEERAVQAIDNNNLSIAQQRAKTFWSLMYENSSIRLADARQGSRLA